MTEDFTFIAHYWRDPKFAASVDAEGAQRYTEANAAIDDGMAPLNEKQALRWAMENEHADRN